MKFVKSNSYCYKSGVAPLVGAWIEIGYLVVEDFDTKSLPSWERGLKSRQKLLINLKQSSLPSWERGLKLLQSCMHCYHYTSLPSWERGLKLHPRRSALCRSTVAPLVGAWIEILLDIIPIIVIIVAPLVGAWIEIPFADTIEKFSKLSLPSWERGLK